MFDSCRLNAAQREVVEHERGPLLVVAGAGTGKTWTLASRLARLIERGTPPDRILLLTFTRRAAREMLSRAERLVSGDGLGSGGRSGGRVWGGTFHAVANRLLRLHGGAIGVRPDFTILDQADSADVLNLVRSDLGVAQSERRFPKKETLASIYSRTVNARRRLAEVIEAEFPWCRDDVDAIASIFRTYTERKRRANILDFDDLLLFWHALADRAGEHLGLLFDHVLVDEYQDTNALQAEILVAMRCRDIMVVGDDAQAIYAFRSASVRNILEFPSRFPGTRVLKLEDNYRSTQPILDASNRVIALARERHEKELRATRAGSGRPVLRTCDDESSQSDAVCGEVLRLREVGTPLHRQAVLFRAAHHSDLLEVELSRRNIPFVKYGGLRFLESAHVKDALGVMRLLENPHDEIAWFRVLQLLEGVGPATARRMMASLGVDSGADPARRDVPAESPVRRLIDRPPAVPAMLGADARSLRETMSDCLDAGMTPAAELDRVRRFLGPILRRRYDGAEARLRDLEQLEALASGSGDRARFLADLTLDPPSSTEDLAGPPGLDDDYLVLSTIHSAKGCEWDAVHVIHAADGNIPSDLATGTSDGVEEERRLFYVALTRARNVLNVYFPLRYHRRPRGLDDAHGYAQLTRFLPPPVLETFDRDGATAPPRDRIGVEPAAPFEVPAVDALLDELWSTAGNSSAPD